MITPRIFLKGKQQSTKFLYTLIAASGTLSFFFSSSSSSSSASSPSSSSSSSDSTQSFHASQNEATSNSIRPRGAAMIKDIRTEIGKKKKKNRRAFGDYHLQQTGSVYEKQCYNYNVNFQEEDLKEEKTIQSENSSLFRIDWLKKKMNILNDILNASINLGRCYSICEGNEKEKVEKEIEPILSEEGSTNSFQYSSTPDIERKGRFNNKKFIRTFKTEKCKIFVKDVALLERKLEKFQTDGHERLQVISDFDFTMTQFFLPNSTERSPSCHKVLEDCGLLSPEYHNVAQALQKKYYPLEIDPEIPLPQKILYMEEWVTIAHNELIRSGMAKSVISKAVEKSPLQLRKGVSSLVDLSAEQGFPFLIFSAGIANVIEEVMQRQAFLPPTLHIVSNTMIFGGREHNYTLIDFEDPVFHVFNKRVGSVLDKYDYFKQNDYHQRTNILLIGDSLGDLHMSDGLTEYFSIHGQQKRNQNGNGEGETKGKENAIGNENENEKDVYDLEDHIIRIGFLNDRVEDRYNEYIHKFDIVLVGDGDFEFVLILLKNILQGEKGKKLLLQSL